MHDAAQIRVSGQARRQRSAIDGFIDGNDVATRAKRRQAPRQGRADAETVGQHQPIAIGKRRRHRGLARKQHRLTE